MKLHHVALATAVALSLATPAAAGVVPIEYSLTASSSGKDVNLGTLTLDYDGSTYSLDSLFINVGKTGFVTADVTLAPVAGTSDYCLYSLSSCSVVADKDSLYFIFDPSLASQTTSLFVYSTADQATESASLLIDRSVPEPGTWLMMLMGLGAIAVFARCQRGRTVSISA